MPCASFQLENLDQLTEGLKYGTPIAKMYGQSLETLNTVMGMLNNAGITGTSAGTAYTAMMEKLVPASKKLGFAIAHAKDGTIDFGGTLTNIHKKFGDFAKASDTTKDAITEAFGRRGLVGVALLSDKAGEFSDNLAKINANAGAASAAAAIMESRGSGPLEILKNKADAVKVALGDALQPATGPLVAKLGNIVDAIGKWVDKNHDVIATDVNKFIKEFGDSLPKIVTWGERIGKIVGVLGGFMLAVKMATGAVALFDLVSEVNPWVLLAYTLAILTALVVAFWPEIKKHGEMIGAVALVTGTLAFALKGQAMWTGIVTGVTTIATKGMKLYAFATDAAATASGAASAGFIPLLITLAAVALAVGGVYAAVKQLSDLLDVTGGWKGLVSGANSFFMNGSFFEGVDAYQNAQAKAGNPDAKAAADAAAPPDPIAWLQSMMAKGGTPGMPGLPLALTAGLPPGLAGGQGNDPMAALNALLTQQGIPNAGAPRTSPQAASKDAAKDLADTLGPVLTEALKKGKGTVIVDVRGGKGSVDQQPDSGFSLEMTPSGGI
jgi:hypothetical protein